MKKRGRPAKKAVTPTEVSNMEEETVIEKQARPDPSNRANRPRRSSAGGAGSGGVLKVIGDKDPNFSYRTVNDEGSRIDEMKSFGYDVVQGNDVSYSSSNEISSGSSHSVVVDKRTGAKAVLMRQPKEFHDEDQKAKDDIVANTEKSMFRNLKTEDGRYGDIEQSDSLAKKNDE